MAANSHFSIYILTYENVWHLEKIWLKSSNCWHVTIGAGSALKSNVWQAIDWTNAEPVPLHIFVRPWLLLTHWGRDKLTAYFLPTILKFQMHSVERKCKILYWNCTSICSQGFNQHDSGIV